MAELSSKALTKSRNMPEMEAKTPLGTITARYSADPHYPGIVLYINDDQAVVLEYHEVYGTHVAHLWLNNEQEDPDITRSFLY